MPIIKEIDNAPVLFRKTRSGHDIIVMGASAGGVETLSQLVGGLPKDLPAAIFIVVHFPRWGKSVLPDILNRKGYLSAAHGTDSEVIVPGRIYVAPPDYHLVVKRGYIRLVHSPMENSCRPAVDPLFRTAAKAYGQRVIGVILSGTLDDGTAGLMDVKHYSGVAFVDFSPPSVDLLLQSVAASFKERAIALPMFPDQAVSCTGAFQPILSFNAIQS